ncbi:MAG TPA: PQQ-binding-like beta-propeller repeat protein [Rhizomicrobium sp.]
MKIMCSLATGVALAALGLGVSQTLAASSGDDAVAYQINAAHSGSNEISGFKGKLKLLWTKNLGAGAISYPLIAVGQVYVTVANTTGYGTQLFALESANGVVNWQQPISGTYFWSNAAYDNGQIFLVTYDGVLDNFSSGSGSLNWSVQLPGYSFSSPPTAEKGQVFVGGNGALNAVSEATGAINWSGGVQNGDNSSPALGDKGVYVTYPCQYYKFGEKSGKLDWNTNLGCEGGGGRTPVYFKNEVFVRDWTEPNNVLDAKTGASLGTFTGGPAPAFGGEKHKTFGVGLSGGTLSLFDFKTRTTKWTFAGDGTLSTAPIIVNGYIVEGGTSGMLYVLNDKGKVTWSGNVGASIPGPDEQNVSQPLTGLAAADGIIVVPAGSQISAYAPE